MIHSDNDFATVAYLRVRRGSLVGKGQASSDPIEPPDMLSEEFDEIRHILSDAAKNPAYQELEARVQTELVEVAPTRPTSARIGPWVVVTNASADPYLCKLMSVEDETIACFKTPRG